MISPDDPRLTAYALGELRGRDREEIEAALAESEELRRVVEEIRASAGELSSALQQEVPARLDATHRNAIETQLASTSGSARSFGRFGPAARAAAVVVLTAGAAWLVWSSWNLQEQRDKRSAAAALIRRVQHALSRYQSDFGTLPPDTGYGLPMDDSGAGAGRTYDPGSLWRYLAQARSPETNHPYVNFSSAELVSYDDPVYGTSCCVVDPWGSRLGYVGDPRRVIHNPGSFDIYSAGPDRKTHQDIGIRNSGPNRAYDGIDNDGDGVVDNAEELGTAAYNGCLTLANAGTAPSESLDDLNNWDPN